MPPCGTRSKGKLKQNAYGLSGGQQQRLCIARAIATKPEVILMDEPCSSLDPIATAKIEDLMTELAGPTRSSSSPTTCSRPPGCPTEPRSSPPKSTTHGQRTGKLVEFDKTAKIFGNPTDPRTEAYITGRFG